MTSPDPIKREGDSPSEKPKKRKRRKWPWVLVGIVVFLILLVLLAPTLIGTGPIRSFIAGKASDYINGSVKIDELSLGWTSGTRVGGVKIYDDKGVLILELDQLKTDLSLLDAVRGNFALGETLVDANLTKCTVYEDGTTNYQKLAKAPSGATTGNKSGGTSGQSKLPDVSGNITVKYRGTIDGPGVQQAVKADAIHVEPSSAVVKITNINQPITNDVKLSYRLGNAAPASVSLAGTIDAIENNQVNIDQLKSDEKLQLTQVDLAVASPFLSSATQKIELGGVANGTIDLKADTLKNATASGAIVVANFLAGGTPLKGDTYRTSKLNLPVNITATGLDANNTLFKIEQLAVQTDQASVVVSGQVTQQAIQNIAKQQKPGSEGNLAVNVDVTKLGDLANQLPHLLSLQEGVKITEGTLKTSTNVKLTAEQIVVGQTARVEAAGTNIKGQRVVLQPIELKKLDVAVVPTGQKLPDIRDIALELVSPFATAKTNGTNQSLSNLNITGDVDLAKAHQQLAQFSDLGGMKFSGTGNFSVTSQGDLTKPKGTAKATAGVDLKNVIVSGLKDRPDVNQPHLNTTASATLLRGGEGAEGFLESIQGIVVTAVSGEPQAPVLEFETKVASVNLNPIKTEQAEITKLNIPDLAKAQQQFGGFVPALKDFQVQQGQLYSNTTANYDGTTLTFVKPLNLSVRNLSLAKVQPDGRPAQLLARENFAVNISGKVAMPKDGNITAELSQIAVNQPENTSKLLKINNTKPIAVTINRKGGISGNGALQLVADIKRAMDLQKAMASAPASADAPASGQITSGQLNTTITLDHPVDAKQTTIALDGGIDNLSVTNAQNQPAIANEKLTLALKAASPDDFSAITVESGTLASSFATTKLDKTVVNLNAQNIFDKLTQAALEVTVPDLPRAYALYTAMFPPQVEVVAQPAAAKTPPAPSTQPQPLPPLEVRSGAANVKVQITRENNVTKITAPAVTLTRLSIVRGNQLYQAPANRSVNLQLAASITPAPPPASTATTQSIAQQIQKLEITQLGGDLMVAQLQSQPITIQGLASGYLSASGAVKLSGQIQELTPLLAVLQGKPAMTYAGKYDVAQSIATQQNQIVLKGDVAVPDFQTDAKAQAQNLAIKNDVVAENFTSDAPQKNIAINALSVAMPDTSAVGLAINNAKILDVTKQRQFENFVVNLSYDLAQLWPIVKPMLSAEAQKKYEDMKIAGKYTRDFHVSGSYPANDPDPMKYVQADGAFAVDQLDTNGLALAIPEQQFTLKNGHLQTPKPQKPATCNGGTIDLGSLDVWLAPGGTLVSLPKKHPLMRAVQLNPVLADRLGSKASILFKDATQAGGAVSVTANDFRSVPITKLTQHGSRANATLTMSIENLKLNGTVTRLLAQFAKFGNEGIVGEVRDAVIILNDGYSKSDLPITIERRGKPEVLRVSGTIDLVTNKLMEDYVVHIAGGLLGSDALAKAGGIALPVKGTLSSMTIDGSRVLEEQVKSTLGGLLTGNKQDANAKPDEKKPNDPLGGLIEQLTKPKEDQPPKQDPPKKKKK